MEAGWVQKRLYDIGWTDEKKCGGCISEEGTEKHRDRAIARVGGKLETRSQKNWRNGSRGPKAKRNHVALP